MEDNLRTALMVVSALAIFGILIHGLWKIRKNRNPYKLKAKTDELGPLERKVDSAGFDQDGIGEKRVIQETVKSEEPDTSYLHQEEVVEEPAPAPDFAEEPIPQDIAPKEPQLHESNEPAIELPEEKIEPVILESAPEPEPEKSVYDAPVTQPKPERAKPIAKKRTKKAVNTNQIGFDFDDEITADLEKVEPKISEPKAEPAIEVEQEVLILSVVMPENHMISGAALLPTLLTLGMKYGEMDIFHRHQDNAGNGKVTFSLANMMNPGTFDLDTMESFATRGVSLFMTLPNASDAFIVFEQMLNAAKQLAKEFNGQVLDDKRSVMTKQTEQHYVSRIREFDRKYRIAAS